MSVEMEKEQSDFLSILKSEFEWLKNERDNEKVILDSLWHDGHPVCQTEEQAEAIMKMMADAESEEARIKAQYQERLAQVKAKRNKLDFLYKSVLMQWAKGELTGKKKSVTLPQGTLSFRTVAASVKTENEPKLRQWILKHDIDALNLDRAPIRVEVVKEWEEKNGMNAPGRVEHEAEERFYIKFPKPKVEE